MKQVLSHSPYPYNDQSTWMVYRWSPGCIMWDNRVFCLCVLWFLEGEWYIFATLKCCIMCFMGTRWTHWTPRLFCDNEWTGSHSHITRTGELLYLSVFSAPCPTVAAVSGWTYKSWKAQSCSNWSIRKGNNILTQVLPNVASTLWRSQCPASPQHLPLWRQLDKCMCQISEPNLYCTARNFHLCGAQGIPSGLPWFAGCPSGVTCS